MDMVGFAVDLNQPAAPGFDALFGVALELGQHLRGEHAAPVFGDDNQVGSTVRPSGRTLRHTADKKTLSAP